MMRQSLNLNRMNYLGSGVFSIPAKEELAAGSGRGPGRMRFFLRGLVVRAMAWSAALRYGQIFSAAARPICQFREKNCVRSRGKSREPRGFSPWVFASRPPLPPRTCRKTPSFGECRPRPIRSRAAINSMAKARPIGMSRPMNFTSRMTRGRGPPRASSLFVDMLQELRQPSLSQLPLALHPYRLPVFLRRS